MKKKFLLILWLTGLHFSVNAQDLPLSANATGMGNTDAVLQDAYSIFQNVAGMSAIKHVVSITTYHSLYGLSSGLAQMSAGAVVPVRIGVAGIGVSRTGDELFSIHTLSLGYAHQIEQFSMGIRLSQQQYSIEGYGSRSVTLIDIGGIARLSPQLTLGMAISNLNRATISQYTGERKAARLQAGLAYKPITELLLALEIAQQVGEKPQAKVGAAYTWQKKVALRSGFNAAVRQHYFGIGLYHRILKVDYALSTHTHLGCSHMMSLAYHFKP